MQDNIVTSTVRMSQRDLVCENSETVDVSKFLNGNLEKRKTFKSLHAVDDHLLTLVYSKVDDE